VAGRRLVPNVETEICPGQTLSIGSHSFEFDTGAAASGPVQHAGERETDPVPTETIATVLVGDIRDYTALVRRVPTAQLQQSVSRVFESLTSGVIEQGGTIKEYPGDAVLAFWEGAPDGAQTSIACRAALALDRLARRIAADPAIWEVADFPLLMGWALATGPVLIHTFGGAHPQGLSLVGEPVVLAFRLEKLAGDDTGSILTCSSTRALAGTGFAFRDLGEVAPKGFQRRDHVYALLGWSDQATATAALAIPLGRSSEHAGSATARQPLVDG
jgi:class 3 adenylate cyclase